MIEALIRQIRLDTAKAKGLLIPVSGGSDSALGFWLCKQAWPEKTLAVHAGAYRSLRNYEWFESIGRVVYTDTPGHPAEAEEMRWARFLSMSLADGTWLVGSRNMTEYLLGTYSLASRLATYRPLKLVWKSDVLKMSAEVGVPADIIASSLRADPDCGRPQELAEIPYKTIEQYLMLKEGLCTACGDITIEQLAYLDYVYARNTFKRYL